MDDDKKEVKNENTISYADTEDIVEFDDFHSGKFPDSDKKSEKTEKRVTENKSKQEKESKQSKKPSDDSTKEAEKKKPDDSTKEAEKKKPDDSAKESEKKKPDDSAKEAEKKKPDDSAKDVEKKKPDDSTKADKSVKSGKKGLKITLSCFVAILLIAYISGTVYFFGHFYKDVSINGVTVSNMSKDVAGKTLDSFYSNYALTLETIDGEQVVLNGKDIAMNIVLKEDISDCIWKQNPFLWFVNMWQHHEFVVQADAKWDEDALSKVFDSMAILDTSKMKAPKDAYVGFENDQFVIKKEDLGSTIFIPTFKTKVQESLSNVMSQLNLLDAECYKLPSLYETDETIQKDVEDKNAFAKNVIKIQMDDLTLEPGAELYDQVLEKKGDSYQISKAQVKRYVDQLAKQYDTLGESREFTTSFQNKKVEVKGTAFGYKLNCEETTEALYKALSGSSSTTVDAVFDNKGYTLQGENDIGDTYVEVNLSEQRVIAYKNGEKIAEGDCVSGNESAGHGTCIGLYAIQNKLSPTVLRGEKKPVTKTVTKKNKKGKKVKKTTTTYEYEYESPVTYWLQFNGGVGLHDAAGWRSAYGGSIYYYSGSHGCVNLPIDLAKTLYQNFEIGDPVVVYFWDNENRK